MKKFGVCLILFILAMSCFAQTKQQNIRKLVQLISPDIMADSFYSVMQQMGVNAPRSFYVTFFEKNMNDYYDIVIPLYDKYFTQNDIDELLKFYQSPIGKKSLETMGPLMGESMPLMAGWSQKITPLLQSELIKAGYTAW